MRQRISQILQLPAIPVLGAQKRFFSKSPENGFLPKMYQVRFSPSLSRGGKVVIPISMGRYNLSENKTKEYDTILSTLFTQTALLLRLGYLSQVDVISTVYLQRINWDNGLADRIEQHFLNIHGDLLLQQSGNYTWDEWIDAKGKVLFEQHYNTVIEQSQEGSEWYKRMVKTHEESEMSNDLTKSLEYQRREYAGIMLMEDYDAVVYDDSISSGWAYMYNLFADRRLPKFVRADFKSQGKEHLNAEFNRIWLNSIEQVVTSQNLPAHQKEAFMRSGLNLLYTHSAKNS